MKNFTLLLFTIVLSAWAHKLCSQCTTTINSNQYTVTIELTPVAIVAPEECPFGYNFNVVIRYAVTFSGNNPPQNGLNTLQGNMECGSFTNNFFDLPNEGGVGTTTTTGNPYNSNSDCADASVNSLMCNNLRLEIQGPGIRRQSINCAVVLPVEFTDFKAENDDGKVLLQWSTASEIDNDFFAIERSANLRDWDEIGRIKGSGSRNSETNYSFTDFYPKAGTSYYRLKQFDFDGAFEYSMVQSVLIEKNYFNLYPNPTKGMIYSNSDLQGAKIFTFDGLLLYIESDQTRQIDTGDLPKGSYFVKIDDEIFKLIKI